MNISPARLVLFSAALTAAAISTVKVFLYLAVKPDGWMLDFAVFWKAAQSATPYAPADMPFAYPPPALLLFTPFSWLPQTASWLVWAGLSVAVFIWGSTKLFGRAAPLALIPEAATRGLLLGQSAMLLGGSILCTLRLSLFASGAVWAAAGLVKPQLAIMAPLAFLVRREWKALAGMALVGVIAVIVTTLMFKPSIWLDWLQALPGFHAVLERDNVLSWVVSPTGRGSSLGLDWAPVQFASVALACFSIVALAPKVDRELLIGLIVVASLVASPYAHVHDTAVLIPIALVLILRGSWWLAIPSALLLTGIPGAVTVVLVSVLLIGVGAFSFGPLKNSKIPMAGTVARARPVEDPELPDGPAPTV